jgi:hypothetical protein
MAIQTNTSKPANAVQDDRSKKNILDMGEKNIIGNYFNVSLG